MNSAMAKRAVAFTCAAGAVVFALMLAACSGGSAASSSVEASGPGSDASSSAASASAESASAESEMTMGELLSGRYASFDTFDEGIQSGQEIPKSLRLLITGEYDGYVHDQDVIVECWNALSAIRVDTGKTASRTLHPNVTVFDFDSGSEIIPFNFHSAKYAELDSKTLCSVVDPDEVSELVDAIKECAEVEKKANAGKLVEENGVYLWDADGDGNPEHLDIGFIDNGDEAPGVMVANLYGYITGIDTTAYIDGGYGLESIECGEDDIGPYVLVEYTRGDYYSHDSLAQCKLRLSDNELVVEELE